MKDTERFRRVRSYIQYKELPKLNSADVIVNASLSLLCYQKSSETPLVVEAHKVFKTWDSKYITWDTQPAFDAKIEDFALVGAEGRYSWDITDIAREWYANSNTGVMLKAPDTVENAEINNWKKFYSIDFSSESSSSSIWPRLQIVYRNTNGLESYWDYTTTSAGRAGTGYVNNYSGNLTWVHGDIGFGGNRMPVSISHIYNSSEAQTNAFGLGYGWRTNYNQTVSIANIVDDGNNKLSTNAVYVWTDGDGTNHYFISKDNEYVDEDGLELKLTVTSTGYTITDKDGNRSNFDINGRLISMVNNQEDESKIEISYTDSTGLRISKITDGATRFYHFSYNSEELLEKISYTGKGASEISRVTYTYINSRLVAITDKDSESSTFTYGTNGLLETVTDVDGYKVGFFYNTVQTVGNEKKPIRVIRVQEWDDSAEGRFLTIDYTQNQTTLTDHNTNTHIIQFNDWGNVVSVQDDQGRAQFAQYARTKYGETGGKANQLTLSSKMQNTVGNILKESSFENGLTWTANTSTNTRTRTTQEAYQGNYSLQVVSSTGGWDFGVYGGPVSVASGETITLSAYVKNPDAAARLGFTYRYNNSGQVEQGPLFPASDKWVRVEESFTNTTEETLSVYTYLFTPSAGTYYLDCVQVEKAPTASRYNLIENGDFRYSGSPAYGWTSSGLSATDTLITNIVNDHPESAAPELDATVLKIAGNPTSAKTLSQTLNISGSKGDCYVLGGWAKGDSVPLGEVNGVKRGFGLKLTFNYTEETNESPVVDVSFNCDLPSNGNWQYAATPAVAKAAYSSITVELVYSYNANEVYFDGIQLFKEQFGSSYTYDSNGNVTKVEDIQKQETEYKYEDNKLTEIIQNGNAKMTYTYYQNSHNVETATTGTGVVYKFIYDTYGNNTSVSIVSGDTEITSSADYSDDGNRLESTTDALDKTTYYGYNETTNVLEWVKYPNDTDATRTEYSYDSMYRLASSSVDLDPNTTLSVSYTYTDDLLTKIQTNSTTYNFAYGAFSQRTGVYVGTQALATYTYTDNQNRWLASIVYGGEETEGEESHSDKVTYSYDDQGRVTEEVYYDDGSETPSRTISYAYDNSGALATVTDSKTGRTTRYYYDLTDRMMKYVESGEGYSHSVGYEYDTLNNLTHLVETINGIEHTTRYDYDADNRITSITNGIDDNSATKEYVYDAFGRITQRFTNLGEERLLTETITYVGNSTQVASITTVSDGYSVTYFYTYDNNGNISTVSDGTYCTQYFYDTANQLIRENNQQGNFTCTWTYDDAGNILTRTVYPYTTGEPGEEHDTFSYTYGDNNWGDVLTAYDGVTIDRDEIGNPLNDGTWDYLWEQGRQLVSMYAEDIGGEANDITIDYIYDGNGMRVGKTVTKRNYLTHQHSYTATIVPPTCTEGGYTWYECDCGDAYQDDVTSATGHSHVSTVVAPTCTEDGYTLHECVCGDVYQDNVTPATGHSHVSTVVAPTCTEDGYTLHECVCGDSYQTDETAALGHSYADSIFEDPETGALYTLYSCTRCDHSYADHTHAYVITVVVPTCTKSGYTLHQCNCGNSYQSDPVDPLGHSYYTSTDPITGEETEICSRCGHKKLVITPTDPFIPVDPIIPVIPPVNPPGEVMSYSMRPGEERTLESTIVQEFAYVYNGGTLMQMVIETTVDEGEPVTEVLSFSYDASGLPMSVVYNGTAYYYTVNLQGDVMAIVDATGTAVVSYTYDAWGNILSVTGSMADTLGESNPLRYRGYVYDNETELYYLQSRYYNPAMGRFINADAFTSTCQGLLGNNMFAYCLNNPITYADSSGMLPLDNNRFRSHTTLNGGGNLCDGGISGVVRGEQPDWIKALDPANQDERVVLEAEYFAFYQGALVIRMKGNQGHGFSVGIIVLDEYYGYDDYGIQTLKHEYGHTLHCLQLGLPEYLLKAGIPSVIGYNLDKANIIPKEMYYNLPWERIADMFSNVSRSEHIPGADAVAIIYWLLTLLG